MEIVLDPGTPFLFPTAIGLSVLTVAFVLLALFDLWRRKDFPLVAYGGVTLTKRRMRWVWVLVLVGAFGFAVKEEPASTRSFFSEGLDAVKAAGPSRTVTVDLPLPFYRYERARYFADGERVGEEGAEHVSIPWPLLSALFAYWVLVVRWNPGNPFARRLLQGRRWRRELERENSGGSALE